jgi:class 3 adenylate cyclase
VLLGRFGLTGPRGAVDLGSKKLCALLAHLACTAPQPQSRETLTALLWGSHFETQARQNLRQALSRLRRALGEEAIVSTEDSISIRREMFRCDAVEFEALIREGTRDALGAAVDLYGGTFLANIAIPQDAWTDWMNDQRHRLENLAVDALVHLGEEEERLGNAARALEMANRTVAIDALREDGHRLIMRSLASMGRRTEALKHYEHLASLLKRDLDVEPDADTAALIAELRRPRPATPAAKTGGVRPAQAPASARTQGGLAEAPPAAASPPQPVEAIDSASARPESLPRAESPDAGPVGAATTPVAERRQVSVMFCDLVGSTALLERLDPEEFAAVIARYQQAAREVVGSFGGHVAKFLGDGVMACFGWPAAHEDDAERALRAGLRLIETIAKMPSSGDERLLARVGVATGLVVIGGSHPDAGDGDIAGLTPNIAYRLQSEADANMLVATPMTAQLAGRAFYYRGLGKRSIKGISEPLEVLQVLGSGVGHSRFETRRGRSDAPLIGRDEEIRLLLNRWRLATGAEGQVVLLSGDAGIGKSRLVHAASHQIKPDGLVLRFQCSPLHQDIALFPIIEQVQAAAGIEAADSVEDKVAKLEAILRQTGVDTAEHLPFQCHLLQIESKAHRLPDLSPQQLRERMVGALWAQLCGLARHGPILLILEDAQWIDPTTEGLMLRVMAGLGPLPMMVIATSRDAFRPRWQAHGYTTTLSLNRLSAADSRQLTRAIAGDGLSADVQARIAARAEGVPLYLEELTLSLLEPAHAGQPRDGEDVPVTLQALLATRLDRMGEAKRLVQVGAVLGRQFTPGDVKAVSGCTQAELDAMMGQALASGLLHQHGAGDDAPLVFKHALVHDAAYASLLNSEKKRLHRAALQHLETRAALVGGAATLALHAERGEVWDKAARYLVAACTAAIRGSANREAIVLFDRALRALDHLPAEAAAPLAIDVRLHVFSALLALGEIGRLDQVRREAEALARDLGDRRRLAAAMNQLANALWLAGEHQAGLRMVEEAERLADELEDLVLRLHSRFNRANLFHAVGRIREAADMYAGIADHLRGELEFKRLGFPGLPSVLARSFGAWSLVLLGDFARARQAVDRAHEVASQVRQPYSMLYAHLASGVYHATLGEVDVAIAALEAACAINRQVGMGHPIAIAWLAAAYAQAGRAREGLPLLLEAQRDGTYRFGGKYNWAYHYMALAQTYLGLHDLAAARKAIGDAQGICETTGELAHLAWALKLRGDIEIADPSAGAAPAGDAYRRAMALAEQCGLRPLLAHCQAGLAGLHDKAGVPDLAAWHRAAADALFDELGMPRWRSAGAASLQ